MNKISLFATLCILACGPNVPVGSTATKSGFALGSAETVPSTTTAGPNNAADTSCQVILRTANLAGVGGRQGGENYCDGTVCWWVAVATADVAMSQVLAGSTPGLIYQGTAGQGSTGAWHTLSGTPIAGAPMGYVRYLFTMDTDTYCEGPADDSCAAYDYGASQPSDLNPAIQLIPFITTPAGESLFDHNVNPDPTGNYILNVQDGYAYPYDNASGAPVAQNPNACQGAAPAGAETLTFATGWQSSVSGSLVQSGKLDVDYDIYRIPQGLGCSTDGVNAVAVTAYAQFQPENQVLSEEINGPFNADAGVFTSFPAEFDVPSDATSVSLWFLDSSACTGDSWDSNESQNYVYSVAR